MEIEEKVTLLLHVLNRLNKRKNKSGETSVQKILYLIQKMTDVNFGYEYQLHNYGPYSFSLKDDINLMENTNVICKEPDPTGFGFKLVPNADLDLVEKMLKSRSKYEGRVDTVLDEFEMMHAKTLALLTTFMYVIEKESDKTDDEIIKIVHKIKPMYNNSEYDFMLKKAKKILDIK